MHGYLQVHELGHAMMPEETLFEEINKRREMLGLPKIEEEGPMAMIDELAMEALGVYCLYRHLEKNGMLDNKHCREVLDAVFAEFVDIMEVESPENGLPGANYYYSERKIALRLLTQKVFNFHRGYPKPYYTLKDPKKGLQSIIRIWWRLWDDIYNPNLELTVVENNIRQHVELLTRGFMSLRHDQLLSILELPARRVIKFDSV